MTTPERAESAATWLRSMPSAEDLVCALVPALLTSRGAVSEDTCVPTSQVHAFIEEIGHAHFDFTLFQLLLDGLVACEPSAEGAGNTRWWLTEKGRAVGVTISKEPTP